MKITNTLDHARDIAVDGGFITVDAGGTVDLSDHLEPDAARALAESLSEQDGWTERAKKTSKAAVAAEPDPRVADEPVNKENPDGS